MGGGGPIMNITEKEVVDIIGDVVRHYMDWQDSERESTIKSGSTVYSVDHLNAINNLSSQISNLWKEMTSIKAKLESSSSLTPTFPSKNKGRGTSSNSTLLSTSNKMPSVCLFCDICGSYEHDSSKYHHAFSDGCDDFSSNENEHVNYVSYNNNGSRFDNQRGQGNKNYHNQRNFDNYNQGSGCRNQGNQGFRVTYNNQGYSGQNQGQGYGQHNQGYDNHNQSYGQNINRGNWNNQNRENFQNNAQRGPPPAFAPKTQGQGDDSHAQPSFSSSSNLEEIIEYQTKILITYMTVSDKKFDEMMTHSKMLETQITQLGNTLKVSASSTSLPSQRIEPKKPVYSITTRSGKVFEESVSRKTQEVERVSD
ncbi:homeobox protein 2-like [Chenopodium quinoa]|uniref:homeobox protein 2-like n=1 Tax=Chenopodium quinoa TaxID=63459 RepID=UPI000B799508|nr:homeobox protein 2-like [Chenopodium quinoa]